MTTYEHMIKVSKDQNLTNSQKLHELFKDAKGCGVDVAIDVKESERSDLPKFPQDAEVVYTNAGQTYFVRFPDNSYHVVDTGLYDTGNDKFYMVALNEYEEQDMVYLWDTFLDIDDSPLAFYEGAFHDSDAQNKFLATFPEN